MAGPVPSIQSFPAAPTTMDPGAWQRWANGIRDWMNAFTVTLNQPGAIGAATAVATNNNAVTLRWVPAKNAAYYWIYRGSTGDFSAATLIRQVAASKKAVATYSYLDNQNLSSGNLYYWIVPLNERLVEGPMSPMLTVTAFSTSAASTIVFNNLVKTLFKFQLPDPLPLGTAGGGTIQYCVNLYDGTNVQVETGMQEFAFEFKTAAGGSAIAALGTPVQKITAGALTVGWFITSGTGEIAVNVEPSSTFAVTTGFINFAIVNLSNLDIALV